MRLSRFVAALPLLALAACGSPDRARPDGGPSTTKSAAPHPGPAAGEAASEASHDGIGVRGAMPPLPAELPASVASGAGPAAWSSAAEPAGATSMIVRTGTAAVRVDTLEPAIAAVRAAAARLGGWVANATLQGGHDQVRSATLELKIPAARFDALTSALDGVGELERLDVTAEDVGEEYVDVAARVANARRLEERLIALLERSGGRLADVLAVERELARVREEIERHEGRLRYLRTRTATSTLTVTLHEPLPLVARAPGGGPIARALRQAWRNAVGVVAGLIAALGALAPLALVAGGAYLALRPAWRRRGRAGGPPAAPSSDPARRDRAA